MKKQNVGVIGLAVMGKNLALNIADHGYSVSVYNRTPDKTTELLQEAEGLDMAGKSTLEELAQSLELPRKIILMVKAGEAVDKVISNLLPLLVKGDIIIDGGNSWFEDTRRRSAMLEAQGIHFIGSGISGGEEGARHGPAIMPGGEFKAYRQVEKILKDISAKAEGEPCCNYIGRDGAGHFVKMVHNGIEYADMQLICEAYAILKDVLGMTPPMLEKTFREWGKGELSSYLIDITADIFAKKDDLSDGFLVDMILDSAGQKGTGKWTSKMALDLGVPVPTITEAVFQRYLSSIKSQRTEASAVLEGPKSNDIRDNLKSSEAAENFAESVRRALYASKLCAYAQGFSMMQSASEEYGWKLDLASIAMIFRGGCIIRALFLNRIKEAYQKEKIASNLLLDEYFSEITGKYQDDWRYTVTEALKSGIPITAFTSALSYYDSLRSARLPMNLLQAQRDYFGAHTYKRIDREGIFHTRWS